MSTTIRTRTMRRSGDRHDPAILPKTHLEIRRGRARHRVRPVQTPVFLIGTAPDCDLVLGDRQFPDVHTYLFLSPDSVVLRHLGAHPEITVNGRPVQATELHDGDRIRTGPFEFRISIQSSFGGS